MRNFNIQISGTTGAGKTATINYLLQRTPRFVVFDPLEEYDGLNAVYVDTFDQAVNYILRNHSSPNARLVFRGDSVALWETLGEQDDSILREFRAFLHFFLYSMYYHNAPAAGLILEESHFYTLEGTRREPWPEIRKLYSFAGRRVAVSSIAVVQTHTDIDPAIRQGAAVYAAFLNTDAPQSLVKEFGQRLTDLKKLEYGERPENGTHYLTKPDGVDIVTEWLAALGVLA